MKIKASRRNAVYYEIQDSRSMRVAEKVLRGYRGTILCDVYGVYEAIAGKQPSVVLAFCWSLLQHECVNAVAERAEENLRKTEELWLVAS